MKKFYSIVLIVILTLTLFSISFAQQTTYTITDPNEVPIFEWDHDGTEDTTGFRLYQSTISGGYQYGPEHCVGSTTKDYHTMSIGILPEQILYFVATAFNKYIESEPSNEIKVVVDYTKPISPENLRFLL